MSKDIIAPIILSTKKQNQILGAIYFQIFNHISDGGALKLSSALLSCQNLINLYLDFSGIYNKISDEGISDIGQGLSKCQYLSFLTLKLSENFIGNEGIDKLAGGLSKCNQLVIFKLDISQSKKVLQQQARFISFCLQVIQMCKSRNIKAKFQITNFSQRQLIAF
ncbi:hypothetical protein ABPG72_015920 [Tetrahymena utriculariae]